MFDFHYQIGTTRRKLHRVKSDMCSIGSARNNDLILDTRKIGKRHAELRMRPDGVHIRDLGSLSGCWVNRERVMEHGPLNDLDEIVIGDVSVVLSAQTGELRVASDTTHTDNDRSVDSKDQTFVDDAHLSDDANHATSAPAEKRSLFRAFGFGQFDKHSKKSIKDTAAIPAEQEPDVSEDATQSTVMKNSANEVIAGSQKSLNEVLEERISEEPDVVEIDDGAGAQIAYWSTVIHDQLLYQMDLRRKDVNRMSDDELRTESVALIDTITESLQSDFPPEMDQKTLKQNVLNEAVGLGPLEKFLEDPEVTEIMVNNHREIFVERSGKLERSKYQFSSDRTVYSVIERIITPLGRRIDEGSPIVDARLKDGSRVNAIIPPLALKGPSLTIRKFPKHRLQFSDLVKFGSVSQSMVDFLHICVDMRKNIIVSGGTGSGKTTLLNVLSNFIPDSDRIVTIEDAAELKLVQPNLVSLESRPSNLEGKGAVPIRDLVKNSLRMRPDRVVIGECRGGEALDMLQAMNTGHDGSLTTIHANNPRDVISRLEVLVLMAGMDLPVTAIREQVASAVHMIIQQTRFHCGSRKISKVTEVVGVESGTVQLQDIFVFDQQGVDENGKVRGSFKATGNIPTFYEELREIGIDVDLDVFRNGNEVGR